MKNKKLIPSIGFIMILLVCVLIASKKTIEVNDKNEEINQTSTTSETQKQVLDEVNQCELYLPMITDSEGKIMEEFQIFHDTVEYTIENDIVIYQLNETQKTEMIRMMEHKLAKEVDDIKGSQFWNDHSDNLIDITMAETYEQVDIYAKTYLELSNQYEESFHNMMKYCAVIKAFRGNSLDKIETYVVLHFEKNDDYDFISIYMRDYPEDFLKHAEDEKQEKNNVYITGYEDEQTAYTELITNVSREEVYHDFSVFHAGFDRECLIAGVEEYYFDIYIFSYETGSIYKCATSELFGDDYEGRFYTIHGYPYLIHDKEYMLRNVVVYELKYELPEGRFYLEEVDIEIPEGERQDLWAYIHSRQNIVNNYLGNGSFRMKDFFSQEGTLDAVAAGLEYTEELNQIFYDTYDVKFDNLSESDYKKVEGVKLHGSVSELADSMFINDYYGPGKIKFIIHYIAEKESINSDTIQFDDIIYHDTYRTYSMEFYSDSVHYSVIYLDCGDIYITKKE